MATIDAQRDDDDAWRKLRALFRSRRLTPGGNWQQKPKMRALALQSYSSDPSSSLERACSEYRMSGEVSQGEADERSYRCCCSQELRTWRYATNRVNGNVLRVGGKCYERFTEARGRYEEVSSMVGSPPTVSLPVSAPVLPPLVSPPSGSPAQPTPEPMITVDVHESLLRETPKGSRFAERCVRTRHHPRTSALERMRVGAQERANRSRERAVAGRREVYLRCLGGVNNALSQVDAALEVLRRAREELVGTVKAMPGLE